MGGMADPTKLSDPYDDEYHVDVMLDIGWGPTAYAGR